jgi:hypothetical protein
MTDPVGEYDHDEGTAGIGGFVYRGNDPLRSSRRAGDGGIMLSADTATSGKERKQ